MRVEDPSRNTYLDGPNISQGWKVKAAMLAATIQRPDVFSFGVPSGSQLRSEQ
jgi:hypothetical protein